MNMPKPEMFQATAQGGEKNSNNACSGSVSRFETDRKPQERHDQNPSSDPQETAEHPGRDAAKAEQQPNHHFLYAPVAELIPLHQMRGSGIGLFPINSQVVPFTRVVTVDWH